MYNQTMLPPALSKADLHLLHVFCAVTRARGFAAAQITLNVSASTISRQITDLETRLGLRLCQRGRKGFRLTQQGHTVYKAAQTLFASVETFAETVNGTRDHLSGKLSIAIVDNWVFNPAAPIHAALAGFAKIAPDVELELHSLAPDDIELAVETGQAALGIGVFHTHRPGLRYRPLSREVIGLYCGRGHPLFHPAPDTDLTATLRQSDYARRAYLREPQVAPISEGLRSSASAHQMEGIAFLILTGRYIGYLPQAYANIWVEQDQMANVGAGRFDLGSEIQLVRKRGDNPGRVVATFLDFLPEFSA